jgi:hypothetical protein
MNAAVAARLVRARVARLGPAWQVRRGVASPVGVAWRGRRVRVCHGRAGRRTAWRGVARYVKARQAWARQGSHGKVRSVMATPCTSWRGSARQSRPVLARARPVQVGRAARPGGARQSGFGVVRLRPGLARPGTAWQSRHRSARPVVGNAGFGRARLGVPSKAFGPAVGRRTEW